ncbi:hypothetical protein FXO37_23551 [Capsicum annuum]|nr:hypothetical protein FXO37_23551 [Capsicum annuum]
MNQHDDFVAALSRGVNYFMHNDKNHQIRIFSWTIEFNPKEETSFPNLSMDLFSKRSLISIAPAVEIPIDLDKATQVRSRPSTIRVRVILDLMDNHPNLIRLQSVNKVTGIIIEEFQEVVYDNLPQY